MPGSNYYDHTTYPSNGVPGSSSAMRSELDLIEAGFGKLPDLSIANADLPVFQNSAGTALETISAASARAKLGTGTNLWCGTATGAKNALSLTPTPAVTAYVAGQRFLFKSGSAASDAAVIAAVSGLPSIAVQVNGAALVGGEIAADTWYEIVIDASLTSCQLSKIGRMTLAELGLSASSGSSLVGFIQSGTGAVATTEQTELRRSYFVGQFGTAAQAAAAASGHRLYINTGETVTLNVPSAFATIQAALTAIEDWIISEGGTVTIQVADGTYNLTAGLNVNHPYGSRIRIVGNETTPANCILSVAGSGFDCLAVTNGNTLGYLNGFTFFKTVKALAADNTTAIIANNGATIICGTKIVVDNWYYGIAARNGSTILCDSASVNHSGDVGIWAFVGSSIQCRSAVSNNAIDVANNLGYGFQAEYGSSMDCESASATGCRIAGIGSLSNSHVRALSATASTNTGSGLLARDGATIEAHSATASTNTRYGVECIADGHVYYTSITAAGNTIANFSPRAYFNNTEALGARIVADDGNLRIDNSGTGSTMFNTSAGCQGGLFSSAGDTHWEWTQASGRARMVVSSSLTNAAGDIEAKGAEVCRMRSNSQIAFQANNSSNLAVNYGQCDGSVTGSPVIFSAQGTDTNIDFQFNPKGSGLPRFGTFTGGADTVSNGYITIKDAAGTTRKLMVTA